MTTSTYEYDETGSGREWVPMSPDRIRNSGLRETGLGRRGYRAEDVDMLVSRLATEIERWSERCHLLQTEVQRLTNYYRDRGVNPDRRVERQAQLSAEAVLMLARAQTYADQVVADAQAQARSVQAEARGMAEAITAQARRDAEQAAHAYRSSAGPAYSADREEAERLSAWANSILATMEAVQKQLAATGEAFALELGKFAQPPQPTFLSQQPVLQPPSAVPPGFADEPTHFRRARDIYRR